MTTREKAHRLLDELPESELEPVMEFLASRTEDAVVMAFRDAPLDDEPWTDGDEAAIAEVRGDRAAGVADVPLEQVMRELGDA